MWDPKKDPPGEQEDDTSDSDAIREDWETVQKYFQAVEDEHATDGASRPSQAEQATERPDEVTALAFSKHLALEDKHELGKRMRYEDAMKALLASTESSRGKVPLALLGRRLGRRKKPPVGLRAASRPARSNRAEASTSTMQPVKVIADFDSLQVDAGDRSKPAGAVEPSASSTTTSPKNG